MSNITYYNQSGGLSLSQIRSNLNKLTSSTGKYAAMKKQQKAEKKKEKKDKDLISTPVETIQTLTHPIHIEPEPVSAPLWQSQTYCDWVLGDSTALTPATCYPEWSGEKTNKTFTKAQLKYLASMLDSSVTLNTQEAQLCEVFKKYDPSSQWIQDQIIYYKSLNNYQILLIYHYSGGGYSMVNRFIRGDMEGVFDLLNQGDDSFAEAFNELLSPEDLTQQGKEDPLSSEQRKTIYWKSEALIRALGKITTDLNNIIVNAPRLDKFIMVYRGIRDMTYLPEDNWSVIKGISSTTLDFTVALNFALDEISNPGNDNIVLRIIAPEGTPCLYVNAGSEARGGKNFMSDEIEILFPSGIWIYVESCIHNQKVTKITPDLVCSNQNPAYISICEGQFDYKG